MSARWLTCWLLLAVNPGWAQDGLPLETVPRRTTSEPALASDCPPELLERAQALARDLKALGYRGRIQASLDPDSGSPTWQAVVFLGGDHVVLRSTGYASIRAALEHRPVAYLVLAGVSPYGAAARRERVSIRGGQSFEVDAQRSATTPEQAERLLALLVEHLAVDADLPEVMRLSYWEGRCRFEVQREQVADDDELIHEASQLLERLRQPSSDAGSPARVTWLADDHVLLDDEVSRLDVELNPQVLRVRRWPLTPPVAHAHEEACDCRVVLEAPLKGLSDALPGRAE